MNLRNVILSFLPFAAAAFVWGLPSMGSLTLSEQRVLAIFVLVATAGITFAYGTLIVSGVFFRLYVFYD